MKVFSGTANEPLAHAICDYIGIKLGKCSVQPFPDGETFVKIEENVRGEDVYVVQPTSPPTNHHLMELFIMMDALRRASAARITVVLPFYGLYRCEEHSAIAVPTVKYFFKSLFFNRKIDSPRVRTMIGGCVWNTTKGPGRSGRPALTFKRGK